VLFCQDPDAAGQEAVGKALALDEMSKRGKTGGLAFRVVRLPPGLDPADVVQRQGAEAMRGLLERAVPIARFEVERALDKGNLETPEGREAALRVVAPVITRLDPGPVQYDLIQLVASRLQMSESRTQEALRSAPRPNGRPSAAPPARAVTSVDRREGTERLFLARCLAIKDAGRAALEDMDIDAMFSIDLTRRAAHYLAEHLEHPGQSLPADADDLAHLIAELVIGAGDLAADREALHIERLQLDKNRLDREIAAAQRAGEPVAALAGERQRVQDEIRHRLV
jgi:DNA primase